MAKEIEYQIDDLPALNQYLRGLGIVSESKREGENCVFVGAGDSFAAAKAAEYFSGPRARALDPYDLCLNPKIVRGRHLFVVSVSGRTKANVEAARAARGIAQKVTAVTSDARSVLAENCDDLIQLRFRKTGELTPGTGSFTASLLACCSLVREVLAVPDVMQAIEQSVRWADATTLPSQGTTFIVGTGPNYCMAIYGAAKILSLIHI